MREDVVAAFLHEPFRSTCGSTDTYCPCPVKPCHVYFLRAFNLMASAIHPLAFLEQHTSVGAFLSGNKNNHIMAHSKSRNVRHTVSHLTADCVETTEDGRLGDVLLDICNDAVELIKILSRLTVKVNIPIEIQFLRIIKIGAFDEKMGHDYDLIATGHYAQTEWDGNNKWLCTSPDPVKDQTDFLAQIYDWQLRKAFFPIGHYMKEEVREIAEREHLVNASSKA